MRCNSTRTWGLNQGESDIREQSRRSQTRRAWGLSVRPCGHQAAYEGGTYGMVEVWLNVTLNEAMLPL